MSNKITLIMPMAGAGSRFAQAGYTKPKPLIDVDGLPMFVKATENIIDDVMTGIHVDKMIYIVDAEMDRKYDLHAVIAQYYPDAHVVSLSDRTQGAACTLLSASAYLEPTDKVVVANCDQYVEVDQNRNDFAEMVELYESGMCVFPCPDKNPKWSFAKLGHGNLISEVAEKDPISDVATVGIYYWSAASMMISSINAMILSNDRVNNEFYICPSFNYLINQGRDCYASYIKRMHGLGTPEDLQTWNERNF